MSEPKARAAESGAHEAVSDTALPELPVMILIPATTDADDAFHQRGVLLVADVLANAGG
jgi:hypothetical protein